MTIRTAGVIGGGAWGTALAQVCARADLDVTLWAREPEVVESIHAMRENRLFLPGVTLHDEIAATTQLSHLAGCEMILAVAPARGADVVTFERDIEPILTRAGCNAGACHGKSGGQNGFALSIFGYDLDFDARPLGGVCDLGADESR